jgi:proteasome lid subunit RPN8/RPN11
LVLVLSSAVRRDLEAWALAGHPRETCGLLVGRTRGERVEVGTAVCARNLNTERARDRYEIDPRDFLAADRLARERGDEIVGVWHSHPDHPAEPSETDRLAAWEGWSYLIVAVTRERVTAMRSWRLARQRFDEESIVP